MSLTTYVNINFSNHLADQTDQQKIETLKRLKAYLKTRKISLEFWGEPTDISDIDNFFKPQFAELLYTNESIRAHTDLLLGYRSDEIAEIGQREKLDRASLDELFDHEYGQIKALEGHVTSGYLTKRQEKYVQSLGFVTTTSPSWCVPKP